MKKLWPLLMFFCAACGSQGESITPPDNTVQSVAVLLDDSHGDYLLRDIEVKTGAYTYLVRYANLDVKVGDKIEVVRYDVETQLLLCNGEVLDVLDNRRVWGDGT